MTAPTARQQRGGNSQAVVRLPDELLKWLRVYAAEQHQSQALIVRQALEEFRATHQG